MAVNVTTGSAIDPVLSGLFYEVMNQDISRVGRIAAPLRAVDGISGQFHQLSGKLGSSDDATDDQFASIRDQPLGANAPSRPSGVEFTTQSIDLDRYADHVFVSDRVRAHWQASGDFDVLKPAMSQLAAIALDRHNRKVMTDIYSTVGNFGDSADPGDLNTASTAYFDNVHDAVRTIWQQTGHAPTDAFCNLEVAQVMLLSDQVSNRAGNGSVSSGMFATMPQLQGFWKEMFGLNLHVDRAYSDSTAGTATAHMGDHIAIVRLASDGSPTFAQTYAQLLPGMDEASLGSVVEEKIWDPLGSKLIADQQYVTRVEFAGAGYLLLNVLS